MRNKKQSQTHVPDTDAHPPRTPTRCPERHAQRPRRTTPGRTSPPPGPPRNLSSSCTAAHISRPTRTLRNTLPTPLYRPLIPASFAFFIDFSQSPFVSCLSSAHIPLLVFAFPFELLPLSLSSLASFFCRLPFFSAFKFIFVFLFHICDVFG